MQGIHFCSYSCSTKLNNIHNLAEERHIWGKKHFPFNAANIHHHFMWSYQKDLSLKWSFNLKAWNYFLWLHTLECLKKHPRKKKKCYSQLLHSKDTYFVLFVFSMFNWIHILSFSPQENTFFSWNLNFSLKNNLKSFIFSNNHIILGPKSFESCTLEIKWLESNKICMMYITYIKYFVSSCPNRWKICNRINNGVKDCYPEDDFSVIAQDFLGE